ncbi:conserved protein of unknown function [Pseudomonas marincola]|uniref:Uncharacterized protein n=1 Tax=Pseudomonas marincola TaxID=437900 RepID=A0A653E4W1_9PSED|nr:conserved protein of unknown function [Pseudomonas marincola]
MAWPGFKPGRGRQPFLGKFDSYCLPPFTLPFPYKSAIRTLVQSLETELQSCFGFLLQISVPNFLEASISGPTTRSSLWIF